MRLHLALGPLYYNIMSCHSGKYTFKLDVEISCGYSVYFVCTTVMSLMKFGAMYVCVLWAQSPHQSVTLNHHWGRDSTDSDLKCVDWCDWFLRLICLQPKFYSDVMIRSLYFGCSWCLRITWQIKDQRNNKEKKVLNVSLTILHIKGIGRQS